MANYTLKNTYRPWIALFSQTGKEICDLAEHFGRWPDLVLTDNYNEFTWAEKMRDYASYTCNQPFDLVRVVIYEYEKFFNSWRHNPQFTSPLITLHGWLKIIPKEICEQYTIYNGHPGLIHPDFSPELKGKDPQKRVWQNNAKYKVIGSVVHEVTPIVDDGKIVSYAYVSNEAKTEQEVYETLRRTSMKAWIDFLGTVL